jgi:hypothetical protein
MALAMTKAAAGSRADTAGSMLRDGGLVILRALLDFPAVILADYVVRRQFQHGR